MEIGIREMGGAAVFFLGVIFAFGRVLLSQFEKRMDERFAALNEMRESRMKAMEDRLATEIGRLNNVQQELNSLANLLPLRFVQRDDWIRFASQIDHKIDRLGELVTRLSMMRAPTDEQR